MHYIDFIPPLIGLENQFNTIRVGGGWAKKLNHADEVYIADSKNKIIIGKALVTGIEVGRLEDLCYQHGHNNHMLVHEDMSPNSDETKAAMMTIITKIYGPKIAAPFRKSVMINLHRID